MLNKEKLLIVLFILLAFLPLIGSAGTISANGQTWETDGKSDQVELNQALEQGGNVELNGYFEIDNGLYVKSNTWLHGSKDTIIKVSPSSSQWFTDPTGIINPSDYPLENVEISGFQLDGSLDELPSSYANSGNGDHNAERAIKLQGNKKAFMSNISIHNMEIYNFFSDGIHIAYAENVICENNIISNCQHEGIFYISVLYGDIQRNEIAGITSDCARLDNCINNTVTDNIFFSYTGKNTNGQAPEGENGLQVADEGFSHGGGSEKPTHTTNIEVSGNTFANGLRPIWLDSTKKGVTNVYVHDNKFVSGEELETAGISVHGIDFTHPPTIEQSKEIFSSIFDILDADIQDSAVTNQTADSIPFSVKEIPIGKVSGGIKIIGFKNKTYIDGIPYISGSNDVLVKYIVDRNPLLNSWSGNVENIDKDVKVTIENGTANAVLNVNVSWYNVKKDYVTRITKKSKIHTSYVTFNDSCPAPGILQRPTEKKGYINEYLNNKTPNTRVYVDPKGMQKIEYRYAGNTTTHTFLIGERQKDEAGIEYTYYTRVDRWDGPIQNIGDSLIIYGSFDSKKLTITCHTPFESFQVTAFEHKVHSIPSDPWEKQRIEFIVKLLFMLFCGYKLLRTIFN